MNSIENQICEAIELITNKIVSQANYDKTIQAIIIGCEDATIGKYKCKSQDSVFYAYAPSTDVFYKDGTTVYVLTPGNDITKEKSIVGAVDRLGINYISAPRGDEAYDYNGMNCITDCPSYQLSSYQPYNSNNNTVYLINIYNSADKENAKINIDEKGLAEYLQQSSSLVCGAVFRTSLTDTQQRKGNFGVIFGLAFQNNGNEKEVIRYYTIDVDNMDGNPYKQTSKRQYAIYDIDGANFVRVDTISLFVKDFPERNADLAISNKDIQITDLEISGANRMSDTELSDCGISFVTPNGTFISENASRTVKLQLTAQVKLKGKKVNTKVQTIPFYWFVEDLTVTEKHTNYNSYGGKGWRCLNSYNIIAGEDNEQQVEWVPSTDSFYFSQDELPAKENRIKCAILYNGIVYSKTIVLKNFASQYTLEIVSDLGTQFYYDIGRPTLTCEVKQNGVKINGCYFVWAREDAYGNLTNYPIDISENQERWDRYSAAVQEKKNLETAIKNGTKWANAEQTNLENFENTIKDCKSYQTIEVLSTNKYGRLMFVAVDEIVNFVTYKCSAFLSNGAYVGTAALTLSNSLDAEGVYTLTIENGNQAFKYNEYGVAPTNSSLEHPIGLLPLKFHVYDNLGNEIEDEVISHCDYEWKVPVKETLITNVQSGTHGTPTADLEYELYKGNGNRELSYNIANKYSEKNTRNDIQLTVTYKGMKLVAHTNFTFVKEGEQGTNGTDYICKIVPNMLNGAAPVYPTFRAIDGQTSGYFNFKRQTDDSNYVGLSASQSNFAPFILKVYRGGEEIFSGSSSGDAVSNGENFRITLTWEMLGNKYNNSKADKSNFTVNNSGFMSFKKDAATLFNAPETDGGANVANILKCTASLGSTTGVGNKYTITATLPIILVKVKNDTYNIKLKDYTGFRYAMYSADGTTPKYDDTPFELEVTEKINNVVENILDIPNASKNINTSTSANFSWQVLGSEMNNFSNKGSFVASENLKNIDSTTKNKEYHIKKYKPTPTYSGLGVTNAVMCTVKRGNTVIGTIHIPIHLYLNKYGLSELNGWDGNSISIDKNGNGAILAPEVGAGIKENDNSFTGVLIGRVKEAGATADKVGLLGYAKGTQSIFLDARSGRAEFGAAGKGQIILDPADNEAIIQSGNYSTAKDSAGGLRINLTEPDIKFGTGNFTVDKQGYLTAKGGGSVAGWNIDDDSLFTGAKTSTSNVRISKVDFERTINTSSRTKLRMAFGSKFAVSSDGTMYAGDAIIGTGTNKITIGKSAGNGAYSAIYSGSKTSFSAANNGFYIGTDGIALGYDSNNDGNQFSVSNSGSLTAKKGYIGGWNIVNDKLYATGDGGKVAAVQAPRDGITYVFAAGGDSHNSYSNCPFRVTKDGALYSTSGKIGGWSITGDSLRSSGAGDFSNSTTGVYLGTNGIRLGSKFSVNSSGVLSCNGASVTGYIKATSGEIGGCTISNGTLQIGNGNITSINASKITAGTLHVDRLSAGCITTSKISDGAVSNSKIANSTISKGKFNSGVKTWVEELAADKISVAELDASQITSGTISASRISTNDLTINAGSISVYGYTNSLGKHTGQTFSMHVQRSLTDRIILYFCKGICTGYTQN